MASEKKRNAYAAESIAGLGAAGVIGSARVPEMVNALVIRRRESEAARKEKKYGTRGPVVEGKQTYKPGTHGLTEDGKKVRLKKLPETQTTPRTPNIDPGTGQQRTNKKGEPVWNPEKTTRPREEAARRAVEGKSVPARALVGNEAKLPFPSSPWEYEPVGTKSPKEQRGRHARGAEPMGRHAKPDPGPAKKMALKAKNMVSPPPEVSDSGKMQRKHWMINENGKAVHTPAYIGEMRRTRLRYIGVPLATAVATHGAYNSLKQQRLLNQQKVSKKVNERDAIAGTVGGIAGLEAYNIQPTVERWGRAKSYAKANENPQTREIIARWKKEQGIRPGEQHGRPVWDKAYRKYPKSLPDWKYRRAMAYAHTGGSGRAAFAGATALGAAGAIAADRKFLRKKKP